MPSTKLISFIVACTFLALAGCGYKPVYRYTKDKIGSVYIKIELDEKEPSNYIVSKNKLVTLLHEKFQVSEFVSKEKADTKIFVTLTNVKFKPIEYKDGFVTKYRTMAYLEFKYQLKNNQEMQTKNIIAEYDYTTREQNLFAAIEQDKQALATNEATLLAIEKFISSLIKI